MGIAIKLAEKPAELVLYEQCKASGLPLVSGGLLDQPHMWMEMYTLIESIQKLYEIESPSAPRKQSEEPKKQVGNFADLLSGAQKRFSR